MSAGEYLVGVACCAVILGASALTATFVVGRRLAWMAIEARIVAFALLFTGSLALIFLVPLAVGALTRGTAVVTAAVLALGASRVRVGEPRPSESARGGQSPAAAWVVSGIAAVAALTYIVAFLRVVRAQAIADIDSTSFILPSLFRLVQSGTLWDAQEWVPGWAFGAYPGTGGLVQLTAILPWKSDFALRAVNPPFIALSGLVVYALAVELRAPRAAAAALGVLGAMLPAAIFSGLGNAQTDAIAAATLAGGALFLVRHARTGERSELWLAALGLGLAFGTKWYGPPQIFALLAVWVIARLVARHGLARVAREAALVAALTVAVGGVWLVRNLVEFANPVFPQPVDPLGVTLFSGSDRTVASGLDYPLVHWIGDSAAIEEYIWPQLVDAFALAGAVILVGCVLAAVVAWRRRWGRVAALACAGLAILIVYAFLPYTANALSPGGFPLVAAAARYAIPGFLVAAAAAAWAWGRLSPEVAGLLSLAGLLHAFSRYEPFSHAPEFDVFAPRQLAIALAVVVVLAGAAFGLAVLLRRRPGLRAAAASATVAALVLVAAGWEAQRDYSATRYRVGDPAVDFFADSPKAGYRVALTGEIPFGRNAITAPAFGPRYQNTVDYLGSRDERLLVRLRSEQAFRGAVTANDYDLLIVGNDANREPPELRWAQRSGWMPAITTERYTLLRPPSS